jgi:methionyl-tRNA formyltransferase
MSTAIVCAFSPVGTEALEGLLEAGIEVKALYTYPQRPDEAWFTPPSDVARAHGIPVHMAPNFNDDSVYRAIRAQAPDFLFSFYFREMIQQRFLDLPRLGAYNLHGSLLPAYRGRAPINWVLVKGESQTGITLHAMTAKPDDGDIIGQTPLPIAWDETALSLTFRAAAAARTLVKSLAPGLADGSCPRTSQKSLGSSTYFGGRGPEDGQLDLAGPLHQAFNLVRAVADPWPNAFLRNAKDQIVKVAWALPSASRCPQGQFKETREGVLLGFRDGALRIQALRREGVRSERPTVHAAWLREFGLPEAE